MRLFKKLLILIVIILIILVLFFFLRYFFVYKDAKRVYIDRTSMPDLPTVNLQTASSHKVIRILVINGGGIRGIIPLEVLSYLEQKTHQPISNLFDIVATTSSGSIVGGLLFMPDKTGRPKYTAAQALAIYQNYAQKFFYRSWLHRILTIDGWIGPKYQTSRKAKTLRAFFDDVRFNQLLRPAVFSTYSIGEGKPVLFDNWHLPGGDYPLWVIVDAATSAPTYFSPTKIIDKANKRALTLVDAALYANDPAIFGLNAAIFNYPNKTYLIVDLGTGHFKSGGTYNNIITWGRLEWANPLVKILLNAQRVSTVDILQQFSHRQDVIKVQHQPFDIKIPLKNSDIDNTSPQNIKELSLLGKKLVKTDKVELDKIANMLVTAN